MIPSFTEDQNCHGIFADNMRETSHSQPTCTVECSPILKGGERKALKKSVITYKNSILTLN